MIKLSRDEYDVIKNAWKLAKKCPIELAKGFDKNRDITKTLTTSNLAYEM